MKANKFIKYSLNIIPLLLQILAFGLLFGSFISLSGNNNFYFNFFNFFEFQAGFAANLIYLILFLVNILLLATFTFFVFSKTSNKKVRLSILLVSVIINIPLTILSFLFTTINNLGENGTSLNLVIGMVLVLQIIFSVIKGVLDLIKHE